MNILVVGDVHGCLNTFKALLDNHWKRDVELLIQVGDLIDRGNFSPQTLLYAVELIEQKNNVVFLKGNHEYELLKHLFNGPNDNWLRQGGDFTLKQFQKAGINIHDYSDWLNKLPLKWENENILITHAGISAEITDPYVEAAKNGVLWNRTSLKNIGKLQIIGHTPLRKNSPEFNETSNSWNIDSGAYLNHGLSALKISEKGDVLEVMNVPTSKNDII